MSSVRLNEHPPAPLRRGQDLLGAMLDAGIPAMYLCMAGSCGRCRVRVTTGGEALAPLTGAEHHHRCGDGTRLACQATLATDADIHLRQPA
jgi:ferredoxin